MQIHIPEFIVALTAYIGLGALFLFCAGAVLTGATVLLRNFFRNRDLYWGVVMYALTRGGYPKKTVEGRIGEIAKRIRSENPEWYERLRVCYWQGKTERQVGHTLELAEYAMSRALKRLEAEKRKHPEILDDELEGVIQQLEDTIVEVKKPIVS